LFNFFSRKRHEGLTLFAGFPGSGTLKAKAFQQGTQYCEKLGKTFKVVSTHEANPPSQKMFTTN
jgi:hypothetical protein